MQTATSASARDNKLLRNALPSHSSARCVAGTFPMFCLYPWGQNWNASLSAVCGFDQPTSPLSFHAFLLHFYRCEKES